MKESIHRKPILYDSIDRKCSKISKSIKTEGRPGISLGCSRMRKLHSHSWNIRDFFWECWKCSKFGCSDGCTTVKILKIIKLYILNGWNTAYVNYISIILFKQKKSTGQKRSLKGNHKLGLNEYENTTYQKVGHSWDSAESKKKRSMI